MIENIIFDMGNVLIQYEPNRYVEKYVEAEADRPLIAQELFGSVEWIRMDRGNISPEDVVTGVCSRLPERLHPIIPVLLDHWHEDIPPFPEMEALIATLKQKGYGIYLLSNTCKKYHHFRTRLPGIELFDGEFISADYGVLKPSPIIFEVFCARFGLLPEQCFFIDDAPANIEGAMHIGMKGFIFRKNMQALRDALKKAGVSL